MNCQTEWILSFWQLCVSPLLLPSRETFTARNRIFVYSISDPLVQQHFDRSSNRPTRRAFRNSPPHKKKEHVGCAWNGRYRLRDVLTLELQGGAVRLMACWHCRGGGGVLIETNQQSRRDHTTIRDSYQEVKKEEKKREAEAAAAVADVAACQQHVISFRQQDKESSMKFKFEPLTLSLLSFRASKINKRNLIFVLAEQGVRESVYHVVKMSAWKLKV